MAVPFAFECFADQDVFLVLRDEAKLTLEKVHSYSQGEVVNDVLVRKRALLGLIDDDPGKPHHARRDQMEVVSSGDYLEVRRSQGRHLILLKPDLEGCFEHSLQRARLKARLENLHRALAVPDPRHRNHVMFREQLAELLRIEGSFMHHLAQRLRELT